jgi:hypothetical protein
LLALAASHTHAETIHMIDPMKNSAFAIRGHGQRSSVDAIVILLVKKKNVNGKIANYKFQSKNNSNHKLIEQNCSMVDGS